MYFSADTLAKPGKYILAKIPVIHWRTWITVLIQFFDLVYRKIPKILSIKFLKSKQVEMPYCSNMLFKSKTLLKQNIIC